MSLTERNVRLYFWFRLLAEPLLWGPILVTYIIRFSGMSLSQVYYLEAGCVVLVTLLQVPTGALADRLGRANAVRIGLGFFLLEMILLALVTNQWLMWLSNICWAIGNAFVSGADSALLYDSLKLTGEESSYRRIEGRAMAYRLVVVAGCSILSGHLAAINLRWPVIIDIVVIAAGLIVSLGFREPPRLTTQPLSYFGHMVASGRFVWTRSAVIWIISFTILVDVTSKLWFFTYNPYFELVGLPLQHFGYVFAALNLVAAASSYYADRLSRRFSSGQSVALIIGLMATTILLMGLMVSRLAVGLVLIQNVVRGYLRPFIGQLMHQHIESENRATILSVKSACSGGVEVIGMTAFGLVTATLPLQHAIVVLGLGFAVGGGLLLICYSRLFVSPVISGEVASA